MLSQNVLDHSPLRMKYLQMTDTIVQIKIFAFTNDLEIIGIFPVSIKCQGTWSSTSLDI